MITVNIFYYVPKMDMFSVFTNHYFNCVATSALKKARDDLVNDSKNFDDPFDIVIQRIELIYH